MAPRPITASFGMNAWDTRLTRETLHWAEIVKRLSTAVQSDIEHVEFMKNRQELKKQDPFVVLGSFVDNKRAGASLESRSALMLDFDECVTELFAALVRGTVHTPFTYLWYTTRSHTSGKPRLRIVIPLARDVSGAEYRLLVVVVAELFPAAILDDGSLQPARIMYLPVQNKGAEFKCGAHVGGGYLNPDCYITEVDPEMLRKVTTRPTLAVVDDGFSALELKQPDPRWTLERVKDGLLKLNPNDVEWDRARWLKLGMILHHQGGGDDGWCDLWDEWSSHDERVNNNGVAMYQPGVCEKEWASFGDRRDAVTIGTFISWVRAAENVHQNPESEAARSNVRFPLRSAADLANAPPMQWLIRGVLPLEGLVSAFGRSGCGKSFLMLAIAAAVAGGDSDWFGYRVTRCPVTYCALEGEGGMGKRVKAWATHQAKPLPDCLRFMTTPFDLLDSAGLAELARSIETAGGARGLVVIDTLNRAAPGADENSSVDMGNIIAAAKRLQDLLGGLVLLVHHTGKDATKGLRGHSSLHAALDGAIEVNATEGRREWIVAKSKDDETGAAHPFKLQVVELGVDDYGDPITSCIVEPDGTSKEMRRPRPQGDTQTLVHKVLARLLRESTDFGKEGAPAGQPCIDVEAAVIAASAALLCEPKRRNTVARRAITGMAARGVYQLRGGWLCAA